MSERPIGYVCGRGHFCFYADPEEDGACGSKKVGEIFVRFTYPDEDGFPANDEIFEESLNSLARIYGEWRES